MPVTQQRNAAINAAKARIAKLSATLKQAAAEHDRLLRRAQDLNFEKREAAEAQEKAELKIAAANRALGQLANRQRSRKPLTDDFGQRIQRDLKEAEDAAAEAERAKDRAAEEGKVAFQQAKDASLVREKAAERLKEARRELARLM